jgi:hypothetical protein
MRWPTVWVGITAVSKVAEYRGSCYPPAVTDVLFAPLFIAKITRVDRLSHPTLFPTYPFRNYFTGRTGSRGGLLSGNLFPGDS